MAKTSHFFIILFVLLVGDFEKPLQGWQFHNSNVMLGIVMTSVFCVGQQELLLISEM